MSSSAPTIADRDELVARVYAVEREARRRKYLKDPASWVTDALGEHLWSKEVEIMESVRDHWGTAVRSCHGPGKSFTAARIITWWISNFPPGEAIAVTTAPTDRQVRVILWKEIIRAHAKGGLPGRTNQKEWHLVMYDGHEEIVAFGLKPADYDPAAFQGIHARWVLVVVDEANGVPDPLIEAAQSLLSNDGCRLLLIGNPIVPQGEFFEACKPGSTYNVIHISAFDTPNFTREPIPPALGPYLVGYDYVERCRAKWARDWTWNAERTRCLPPESDPRGERANPMWLSKIMGEFSQSSDPFALIPIVWIRDAQLRELEPGAPNELGVDVGAGGDSSTICHRRGRVYRIVHEDFDPNTMRTCGNVVDWRKKTSAKRAKIDKIGIGAGVVDRGIELGEPFEGIGVGEAPYCTCATRTNEHDELCATNLFLNLKAQLWWDVREDFESGDVDIDPDDDDLAAELCSLRYQRTSAGKIKIESKEDAKRRGVASPNKAEALMLSRAQRPTVVRPAAGLVF